MSKCAEWSTKISQFRHHDPNNIKHKSGGGDKISYTRTESYQLAIFEGNRNISAWAIVIQSPTKGKKLCSLCSFSEMVKCHSPLS